MGRSRWHNVWVWSSAWHSREWFAKRRASRRSVKERLASPFLLSREDGTHGETRCEESGEEHEWVVKCEGEVVQCRGCGITFGEEHEWDGEEG